MLALWHGFLESLRAAGLRISPAESVEAFRTLERLDLSNREGVRLALRCLLAKDRLAVAAYDREFRRYFGRSLGAGRQGQDREARGAIGGAGRGELGRRGAPERPPRAAPGSRGVPEQQPREPDRPTPERDQRSRRTGAPEAAQRRGPRPVFRPRSSAPRAETPRRRDLSRSLPVAEEERLAVEIPKLLAELRLRAKRRVVVGRSGRLWVKRLLRANLPHGVPFVLPRQERRPRKPRLVLLVDVSFSVARAAGYFLLLALQLLDRFRDARVYLFVDRPIEATAALLRWVGRGQVVPVVSAPIQRYPGGGIRPPGGASFLNLLQSIVGLDLAAPSDYGRMLYSFATGPARLIRRGTVVLMLGDGRTNQYEPLPWALEELAARAQRLLWLVPEPRERWGRDDSALPAYRQHLDYLGEAHDLDGIARGLRELLTA